MSGHTIAWRHDCDQIMGKITCHEPEGAWCRTVCKRDTCQASETRCSCDDPILGPTPCNYVEWIDYSGTIEELKIDSKDDPVRDGAVTFEWDGDCYLWDYEADPVADLDPEQAVERAARAAYQKRVTALGITEPTEWPALLPSTRDGWRADVRPIVLATLGIEQVDQ